jgi:hypothetical protein
MLFLQVIGILISRVISLGLLASFWLLLSFYINIKMGARSDMAHMGAFTNEMMIIG